MFITHPPRQTRENAPTSPCNHGKGKRRPERADAPQAIVGGSRAIVGETRGGAGPSRRSAPTPTGRGLAKISRYKSEVYR